jgi:RNA polymerase sigma-70 factor (ECF subfamily)
MPSRPTLEAGNADERATPHAMVARVRAVWDVVPKEMDDDSDERLLERARGGSAEALERLVERHQARVYRFGMKMCGDPEDAKDVLQDTLLAMARGIRDFRGASSISTWLYTVARSFCVKRRRKSQFAPAVEHSLESEVARDSAALADTARGPEEAVGARRVEQALERAIRTLDPGNREVLLLRDMEGLSAAEVAQVLGLSVQAVKSRLHRARLEVRKAIAPLLDVGTPDAEPERTCPDVLSLLSQHLEGEVSADRCAQMERHLEECNRCRGACDSLKQTLALCRTTGAEATVPPEVQARVRAALKEFLVARSP